MSENIERVLEALDAVANVIRDEFGESYRANINIRKIMAVQADYAAMRVKRDIVEAMPRTRKKKDTL